MKRVVSLLHRQAVRAKAEGIFFQVSREHLSCALRVGDQHACILIGPVRYPP